MRDGQGWKPLSLADDEDEDDEGDDEDDDE